MVDLFELWYENRGIARPKLKPPPITGLVPNLNWDIAAVLRLELRFSMLESAPQDGACWDEEFVFAVLNQGARNLCRSGAEHAGPSVLSLCALVSRSSLWANSPLLRQQSHGLIQYLHGVFPQIWVRFSWFCCSWERSFSMPLTKKQQFSVMEVLAKALAEFR